MSGPGVITGSAPLQSAAETVGSAAERRLEVVAAVCRELYFLAADEDDQAATEAARAPYWATCPASVVGHREAARLLRSDASRLETVLRDAGRAR